MTSRSTRLLLVEDHVDTATTLIRLLQKSGHEVIHASGVADAVVFAEREMRAAGLDLVLSDLALADGSGLDMMRKFSSKYGLRGIALTGFGMDSDRAASAEAGFSRHLTKPFAIETLRQAIDELIEPALQIYA